MNNIENIDQKGNESYNLDKILKILSVISVLVLLIWAERSSVNHVYRSFDSSQYLITTSCTFIILLNSSLNKIRKSDVYAKIAGVLFLVSASAFLGFFMWAFLPLIFEPLFYFAILTNIPFLFFISLPFLLLRYILKKRKEQKNS